MSASFPENPPQVVFLDAVGTLFGVRDSVGQVYREFALRQADIEVNADDLDRAFSDAFKAAPRAEFPGVPPQDLLQHEFDWWLAVARQSFDTVGVLSQFDDFDRFFGHLFAHFATAEPWFIYPDVLPALEYWKQHDIQLGVVSNFDSRLYAVLDALDLAQFFTSVTISTHVGTAKPNPSIWERALAAHDCSPDAAWHIGDSYGEDVEGAMAAGLKGIWLDRRSASHPPHTQYVR